MKVFYFHRNKRGFSLVEVVISVGIVSFAILSIVALLPLGLSIFHDSSEIYYSGQARQQILSNLQQANITKLFSGSSTYNETDFFDGTGIPLATSTQTDPIGMPAGAVYQVAVTVSASPQISIPVANAGGSIKSQVTSAVMVHTVFSRVLVPSSNAQAEASGGTTYREGTDYLYYGN